MKKTQQEDWKGHGWSHPHKFGFFPGPAPNKAGMVWENFEGAMGKRKKVPFLWRARNYTTNRKIYNIAETVYFGNIKLYISYRVCVSTISISKVKCRRTRDGHKKTFLCQGSEAFPPLGMGMQARIWNKWEGWGRHTCPIHSAWRGKNGQKINK